MQVAQTKHAENDVRLMYKKHKKELQVATPPAPAPTPTHSVPVQFGFAGALLERRCRLPYDWEKLASLLIGEMASLQQYLRARLPCA